MMKMNARFATPILQALAVGAALVPIASARIESETSRPSSRTQPSVNWMCRPLAKAARASTSSIATPWTVLARAVNRYSAPLSR